MSQSIDDQAEFRYRCISVSQRPRDSGAPDQVLFAAPATEILRWAHVERLTVKGSGAQRLKNNAKVRAIARFLKRDSRNTIPNAVTIALQSVEIVKSAGGSEEVVIHPADGNVVIDGQHRLFGMSEFASDMLANVVAIVKPDDTEIAFQFLVINNKVTKVPADHIRLLTIQVDQGELSERLKSARIGQGQAALVAVVDNSDDSPFYQSVIWPTEDASEGGRLNLVRPASIEVALSAISQKSLPGLDDEDSLIGFFFALWQPIKDRWAELWQANSKLLGKVGLVTMTQFLIDDMTPLIDRNSIDPTDPDSVSAEVNRILDNMDPQFWLSEWTDSSLDTTAGRKIVVEALTRMRRNMSRGMQWSEEVGLIADPFEDEGDGAS